MVIRKEEKHVVTKAAPFEGNGEITVRDLLDGETAMYGKGRVFCHTTVHPGAGIGYHIHNGESETYYILKGSGSFNDNGKITMVGPGDVLFTGDGEGHGIEASQGEPIEMIALILYR